MLSPLDRGRRKEAFVFFSMKINIDSKNSIKLRKKKEPTLRSYFIKKPKKCLQLLLFNKY